MLPSDLPERPKSSSRPFLVGAFCAFLTGLCLVAFLNWWQNPFYAFEPVIPHISERPPGAILGADRDRQMRWLIRQGADTNATTLLIGSSQFLIGVNTCGQPQMKRLALFFLTDDEITRLLLATVPKLHAQTTFLISVGLSAQQPPPPPLSRLHALWRNLFGQQVTHTSILNLVQSIVPGPRPCDVLPGVPNTQDAMSPEMIDKTLEVASHHIAPPSALEGIFAAIEPQCRRYHHRIVILHMPILFSPSNAAEVLSSEEQQDATARSVVDAFNARHTGCLASFQDLATQYTLANQKSGPNHNDWIDTLHFKPELGKKFLNQILSREAAEMAANGQQ